MCKNLIDIFTKIPCRYFLFSVVFLLVTCYWADAAWALEGYNENNGDVIQNYRLIENKETLSVLLTDLIYY